MVCTIREAIFGCKLVKGICTVPGPIVSYYQVWNHVDGKEFLECFSNNLGCFIAKFFNFKPSGVIVYDNEVDFPVQRSSSEVFSHDLESNKWP